MELHYKYFKFDEIEVEFMGNKKAFKDNYGPHNEWKTVTNILSDVIKEIEGIKVPKSFLFNPKFKISYTIEFYMANLKRKFEFQGVKHKVLYRLEWELLDANEKNMKIDFVENVITHDECQIWEKIFINEKKILERDNQ